MPVGVVAGGLPLRHAMPGCLPSAQPPSLPPPCTRCSLQLLAGASAKNMPNLRNLAMELRKVCCHPVSQEAMVAVQQGGVVGGGAAQSVLPPGVSWMLVM